MEKKKKNRRDRELQVFIIFYFFFFTYGLLESNVDADDEGEEDGVGTEKFRWRQRS